jgi:hypothetical protein
MFPSAGSGGLGGLGASGSSNTGRSADDKVDWLKADIRELHSKLNEVHTSIASSRSSPLSSNMSINNLSNLNATPNKSNGKPNWLDEESIKKVGLSISSTELDIVLKRYQPSKDSKDSMTAIIALMEMWEEYFATSINTVLEDMGLSLRPSTSSQRISSSNAFDSSNASVNGRISPVPSSPSINSSQLVMLRGPSYHRQEIDLPGGVSSFTESYVTDNSKCK